MKAAPPTLESLIPAAAAAIVHDVRNSLATIRLTAEILSREPLSELEMHRLGRNMYGASIRMQERFQEFLEQYLETAWGPVANG
jgi:hypothetical protein